MGAGGGERVDVEFGAQLGELIAGLDGVKDHVSGLSGVFKTLTDNFAAIAAIAATGFGFREAIHKTQELNETALKLSRSLGITGEEAGILSDGLGDVGLSAETYTGSFMRFNRVLKANAEAAREMGVDVDALNNGTKTSRQVFEESLSIVQRYEPGIHQTNAAMRLFGRSVEDTIKLQRFLKVDMEEVAKTHKKLNLTITQESIEAHYAYIKAMDDVGDVSEGLMKTIGEAVMPRFTELSNQLAELGPDLVEGMQAAMTAFNAIWDTMTEIVKLAWGTLSSIVKALGKTFGTVFGQEMPGAMEVFKNALRAVRIAVVEFKMLFELALNGIHTSLSLLGQVLITFAQTSARALRGDFSGAQEAWSKGVAKLSKIVEEGAAKSMTTLGKAREDIEKALFDPMTPSAKTPAGKPEGGTKKFPLGKDDALLKAQMAVEKARLDASLALEREYLRESMYLYDAAYKESLVSTEQYYAAKYAVELRGLELSLEAKRSELKTAEQMRAKADKAAERKQYEAQEIKLLGEINVLEAQRLFLSTKNAEELKNAARAKADALESIAIGGRKGQADFEVSMERGRLQQLQALRQISATEAFEAERELERRGIEATRQMYAEKLELARNDEQKRAEINAELEEQERQHTLRMADINRAAAQERAKYNIMAQEAVQSSFENMLNEFMKGQKKLSDVLRGFVDDLVSSLNRIAAKQLAEGLFGGGGGAGGGLGKGLSAFFGSLFGGGKATGGYVFPGSAYMVGERGPELFVPSTAGSIAPNGAGGSTVVKNYFTIHGQMDLATQSQIAARAGQGVSRAVRRIT